MFFIYSTHDDDNWYDQSYWINALADESNKLHWVEQIVVLSNQLKTFVVIHIKQLVSTFNPFSSDEKDEHEDMFDVM